jgi:cell division protein FtsZ
MINTDGRSGDRTGQPLTFDFADNTRQVARIQVVGVGGAGGNAVNRMIEDGLSGVEFITMNTDLQALEQNKASYRIQIGKNLTKGLGAGGNPEIGKKAIEENKDVVIDALSDTDMVFITCGMGGGTGTGAAPVVAEISRDLGALTVGIVTKPFLFEGDKRMQKADTGIKRLKEHVDTLIVVPNQKLLELVPPNTLLEAAFRKADEILMHATRGISDLINVPGLINLDFADVQAIMSNMGDALMGSSEGEGENRAREAAEQAITSPLIDDSCISGAQGVLLNITGGKDLALKDINDATTIVHDAVGSDANIIFGAVIDPKMENRVRVTVIATGFHGKKKGMADTHIRKEIVDAIADNGKDKGDIPLFQKLEREPLEQTLGDIFGNDGGISFVSKDDLNIPTFIRKQMD